MENLVVSKANALKAFNGANGDGKKLLSDLFGEETFSGKITDRVKSYEDACLVLGIKSVSISHFNFMEENDRKSSYAFHQLTIISRALNEGWVPDWNDHDEYKWYPWFKASSSGLGFSYDAYDGWRTLTGVGSRLCFKNAELAEYAGKQFEAIYSDFMSI